MTREPGSSPDTAGRPRRSGIDRHLRGPGAGIVDRMSTYETVASGKSVTGR
jgi:hypothetical protein